MKIEKFFAPTAIATIDNILNNLSDKDMLEQVTTSIYDFLSSCSSFISPDANISNSAIISGNVYIGSGVTIEDYAVIKGPVIIHDNAFIGQHVLIRGATIIGSNTIVGHGCEIVNSMILNNTTIAHYNIITCSLIGSNVNFSAFASTAAFLLKNTQIRELSVPVILHNAHGESYPANSYKFGSIIGDNCRIGAFTLLNPGVIMEKNCIVYPLLNVSTNYYRECSSIYMEEYQTKFIIQIGQRTSAHKTKLSSKPPRIKAIKIDD